MYILAYIVGEYTHWVPSISMNTEVMVSVDGYFLFFWELLMCTLYEGC